MQSGYVNLSGFIKHIYIYIYALKFYNFSKY